MQKNIHPPYHAVVFRDVSCGATFLTRSTVTSNQTILWEDGNTYPLINLDISSASHPIYTGTQRTQSSEGRVAQFNKRFKRKTAEEQNP